MSPQIKYAYKTHNTWVYRRTYPKALQPLLGSALKQSLKTGDAREAKLRVAELNQTFTTIIKEAQAHALATPHTDTPTAAQGPRLAVGRPRYQRARLVGDGLVADLAQAYLAEVSQRLRPGSYKSVRFALELLCSHLGAVLLGTCPSHMGKEVLGYITQLSPNVRKYRDGKEAGLVELARLSQEQESTTLAPQTQARILKQMSQFLDWCVGEGELVANPWDGLKGQRQARGPPPWDADRSAGHDTSPGKRQGAAQCPLFWLAHRYALRGDLWAHGGGHHSQGEPGTVRQHQAQCGALAEVQGRRAGGALAWGAGEAAGYGTADLRRLFPQLTVDRVVKRYAYLRRRHPELQGHRVPLHPQVVHHPV